MVAIVAAVGGSVFALGDDDTGSSPSSGGDGARSGGGQSTGGPDAAGGTADEFADALAAAIDQQDIDTLNDLTCADAEPSVAAAIDMVDEVDSAVTTGAEEAQPGTYLVALGIVVDDDARPYEATVVERGDGFCVQDIMEDSYADLGVPEEEATGPNPENGGDAGGEAGAEAVAEDFLAAVNDQDEGTAHGMVCSTSEFATETTQAITDAIAADASLRLDPGTVETWGGGVVRALLDGTVGGDAITTGYVSVFPNGDAGWCVYSFYAQWM